MTCPAGPGEGIFGHGRLGARRSWAARTAFRRVFWIPAVRIFLRGDFRLATFFAGFGSTAAAGSTGVDWTASSGAGGGASTTSTGAGLAGGTATVADGCS